MTRELNMVCKKLYSSLGNLYLNAYRALGYQSLNGHGLEIGALHNPAKIPSRCMVEYFDAVSKEDAIKLFPELDKTQIIEPDFIGDLDGGGLKIFGDGIYDFVVINHVVEHVASPIDLINDCFRIIKNNGFLVISCPDKRYTYDKNRALTTYDHLLDDYFNRVCIVTDDHYDDFICHVHPEMMGLPESDYTIALANSKKRKEHAHVWDSKSFKNFMYDTIEMLNVKAVKVYDISGTYTRNEYFSVWQKME